jgi:hypothetical protein
MRWVWDRGCGGSEVWDEGVIGRARPTIRGAHSAPAGPSAPSARPDELNRTTLAALSYNRVSRVAGSNPRHAFSIAWLGNGIATANNAIAVRRPWGGSRGETGVHIVAEAKLEGRRPNGRPLLVALTCFGPHPPARRSIRHDVLATTPYFMAATGDSHAWNRQIINCPPGTVSHIRSSTRAGSSFSNTVRIVNRPSWSSRQMAMCR